MLLLAGLMGMMALGASAFIGIGADDDEETDAEEMATGQEGVEDGESTGSILDLIGPGADPEPDAGGEAEGPEQEDDAAVGNDPADTLDLWLGDKGVAEAEDASLIDALLAADGPEDDPLEVDDTEAPADPEETPDTASDETAPLENILLGTNAGEEIVGTDGVDLINGGAGDDSLSGKAGDDELYGRLDLDTLEGGAGDDSLWGGGDGDWINGGDGDDLAYGENGDDTVMGGAGDDTLTGSIGDDLVLGGDGDDAVSGYLGDDSLRGGLGADTLFGGWGNDTLSGLEDDDETDGWDDMDEGDFLNGGSGDDVITAGAHDIVTLGDGADTVILGNWLSAAHQAQVLDFDPAEDSLLILFDDSLEEEPEVALEPDAENGAIPHVLLNGTRIAEVNTSEGLNVGHLTLVGQSALPQGAML